MFFVFVMVDCILFQNALIDLSLVNLDSSCNLVKLLFSIEQKPVSLNDIVTCRTPIKNERDY